MAVRIAINGFGRIGRNILRALAESDRNDINIVAINSTGSIETNAHLLKYDSIHGRYKREIKITQNSIDVGLGPIAVLTELNPERLPWKDLNIDIGLYDSSIRNYISGNKDYKIYRINDDEVVIISYI